MSADKGKITSADGSGKYVSLCKGISQNFGVQETQLHQSLQIWPILSSSIPFLPSWCHHINLKCHVRWGYSVCFVSATCRIRFFVGFPRISALRLQKRMLCFQGNHRLFRVLSVHLSWVFKDLSMYILSPSFSARLEATIHFHYTPHFDHSAHCYHTRGHPDAWSWLQVSKCDHSRNSFIISCMSYQCHLPLDKGSIMPFYESD